MRILELRPARRASPTFSVSVENPIGCDLGSRCDILMKINSAVFRQSAPDLASCPRWPLPEFAFVGRSNVGKSSLINLLAGRRELAKVSDLPGKTKLINFFICNEAWALVDLPGYGYANVSEQRRLEFNEVVADYLEKRRNLRRVFVLIDSRLPPQAIDLEFLQWLDQTKVAYALVFTKADKQSASRTRAGIAVFMRSLAAWRREVPAIVTSSAKERRGRTEILALITEGLAEAGRA